MGDGNGATAVQLPPGYEDAAPVSVQLPPGFQDAKPASAVDITNPDAMFAASRQQTQQQMDARAAALPRDAGLTTAGTPTPGSPAALAEGQPITPGSNNKIPILSLSGPKPDVPQGMEQTAHIAQSSPAVAGALAGEPGGEALVSTLMDMVPNAKRAGDAFNAVKNVVGDHPVAVTDDLSNSLMRYRELVDAGGSRSLSVEKLLTRLTNPDKGALTFNEARDFYSNISRLSADEAQRLTPPMRRAVGQIANDFGETIADTALRGGKLQQFQGAMSEYAKAMQLKDLKADMAAHGIKYAATAAGSAIGAGAGGYAVKKLIESQAP
jgi:hypothetical protein